jgi:DNA-binding NarL/FixJ family response regulator
MKEIIIVDDHPLVLTALKNILSQAFAETTIRCISSGCEFQELLDRAPSEEKENKEILIAFVDLNLPDIDGITVIQTLSSRFNIPVIAMSGYADPEKVLLCVQSGAAGFIQKSSNIGIYPAVANLVLSGGKFFPVEYLRKNRGEAVAGNQNLSLTARQREVLDLVVDGKPNKIIAATLGLSEGTVKNHVGVLLERFSVKSRSQLILATIKSNV